MSVLVVMGLTLLVLRILRTRANRILPDSCGQLWLSIEAPLPIKTDKNSHFNTLPFRQRIQGRWAAKLASTKVQKTEKKKDTHTNKSFFTLWLCKSNSSKSITFYPPTHTIWFFIRAMYHKYCRNFWSRVRDMTQWIRTSAPQAWSPESGPLALM